MIEKIKTSIFIIAIITIIICSSCLTYLTLHLINEKEVNTIAMLEREENNIKILYNKSETINQSNAHLLTLLKNYYDTNISDNNLTNFTKCIYTSKNTPISDELTTKINHLNTYFASDSSNFAFYYQDINTGFTLSFNANQPVFAASVIKAPVALYIYELANKNEINLDDKLTYTSNYYLGGTGILKDKPQNTEYTIRELVKCSIIHSDNIAYKILVDHFNMKNITEYWQKLGSTTILENGELFSNINALDGGLTMQELYKFSSNNNELSQELMSYFTSEEIAMKLIKSTSTVAHKYGWSGTAIHDMALIDDDNPYILIVLSTKGEQNNFDNLFTTTSNKIKEIHTLYNKNKETNCINQYLKS